MSRQAYRLCSNKYEQDYLDAGFTAEETQKIIDMIWDEDEDVLSKKEYIANAKEKAAYYSKKFGKKLDWELLFGEPMASDYRYCSKCDCYFYESDGCCCDND